MHIPYWIFMWMLIFSLVNNLAWIIAMINLAK